MEIKETKKRNHNWIKELIIILVGVMMLALFNLRADAAESTWTGTFEYNGQTYNYAYVSELTKFSSITYKTTKYTFSKPVYVFYCRSGNSGSFVYLSREYFTVYNDQFGTTYNCGSVGSGENVYYNYSGGETGYNSLSFSVPVNSAANYNDVVNAFINYYLSDKFVGYQLPVEEIDMSLTGFECNKDMEAFWTGISGLSGYAPGELVVEVKPSYMLMLEEGEELKSFEKPDAINVPFEDMSFSNTYDYYFEGNPYKGHAILTLNFTPVFTPNQSEPVVMRGKSIKVTFDKNGEFGGYDIPVDGLVPEYSDIEFVFNNFNALSEVNQGEHIINCMWNGSSIDGLIDYVYSEVKVEIYCLDKESGTWKWLVYPLDKIVSIKTNRLELKLNALAEYALSNNMIYKDVQNGSSMFKDSMIRITPFYKGYSDYVYGKSVVITTTYSGGIKVIQQSNGDGFVENPMYQELGKDYFDDHSPVGDYMDSILEGFDESEMNLDKVTLNFFSLLKGLLSATGQFPALFAAVFSFLPDYFISMIVISLSLVIILRVIGR